MVLAFLNTSCLNGKERSMSPAAIACQPYGTTENGAVVDEYSLINAHGMQVRIITYGGIITSIQVPDRNGHFQNVVLGLNNFRDYETRNPFFGCITGRFANRIAHGRFTLDGISYTLAANNGQNHIHGGEVGFDKRLWRGAPLAGLNEVALKLSYLSHDGEEGYPGNLDVTVTYTLTDANELRIDYHAVTDKPTVLNLTNHSHFNLKGNGMGDASEHILMINADYYTLVDDNLIPTGEIAPVAGTPFDFRIPKSIAAGQRSAHPQIVLGRGYDHNWVLKRQDANDGLLVLAARAYESVTGRILEVLTTTPGLQLYGGNFINATIVGSGGLYRQGDGFALETQFYPDSPNQPHFPSVVLRPDETYQSTTVYRFTTD
jgi:aldose 1-epimerase